MVDKIYSPLHLEDDGIQGAIPSGGILDIGGTASPVFTVGGRALLFADGTATTGNHVGLNLQSIYNNSRDIDGLASIKLETGKDFVVYDDTNNSVFFKIDSRTGTVTISGDLNIIGQSTAVQSAHVEADHWLIQPSTGIRAALQIEPDVGVSQSVDLVNIRSVNGGIPALKIDFSGATTLSKLTTLDGKINNVDVALLQAIVLSHTSNIASRHTAAQISVTPVAVAPSATNVQDALSVISDVVTALQAGGGSNALPSASGGNVFGYSLSQTIPNNVWIVQHNKNTRNLTCTVYNSFGLQIFPNSVQIINTDSVQISFGEPEAGTVVLMLFS